ncbi:hypothetical protein skT53_06910 [Effusibacillus dendaii]|uniref:Uncharacterized protein n=1 Tax=Effusibacillus dendaii TaxID=2743772 RepID=A0A7I8DA55_9BACL|nr:hypothetical protein skT53_06910 [Effusibacillus dendaii]
MIYETPKNHYRWCWECWAYTCTLNFIKKIGDVVLIDIAEGIPQGKAHDMQESVPVESLSKKNYNRPINVQTLSSSFCR